MQIIGQGSLLLTQDDGNATLMHLTKSAVYHGEELTGKPLGVCKLITIAGHNINQKDK